MPSATNDLNRKSTSFEHTSQTIFYLARHGETHWNKEKRLQGQLDSELTALGQQQAKNIAAILQEAKIDFIVSSPLGRALHTAEICQQSIKANLAINPLLAERYLGQWQGRPIQTVETHSDYSSIFHQFTDVCIPKSASAERSESAKECGERVYNAIKTVALNSGNKSALVIFHGEALRCFLLRLGVKFTEDAYQLFANGSVTKVIYHHNQSEFEICLSPQSF